MPEFITQRAIAITPSDTVDEPDLLIRIWVGSTGAIKVDTEAGDTVVFAAVPVGVFDIGLRIKRVYATGTAASSMIGIW